jgi:predicted esterase
MLTVPVAPGAIAIIGLAILTLICLMIWLLLLDGKNKLKGLGIFVIVLGVTTILSIIALIVVQSVEKEKLLTPIKTDKYRKIKGIWYRLPNGGGLLNYTPNAPPNARTILFLHGSSGNLDLYHMAMDKFKDRGFNLWCLEYGGFGAAPGAAGSPNANSLVKDVFEAWKICGNENAILTGFSLGGILAGHVLDDLQPLPAQVVLLNTFPTFTGLVKNKLGWMGSLLSPLLESQWQIKAPQKFKGKVAVIFSSDDSVVPPEESAKICEIFKKLKPQCIELPSGGHRYSSLIFMNSWADVLLQPRLPTPPIPTPNSTPPISNSIPPISTPNSSLPNSALISTTNQTAAASA